MDGGDGGQQGVQLTSMKNGWPSQDYWNFLFINLGKNLGKYILFSWMEKRMGIALLVDPQHSHPTFSECGGNPSFLGWGTPV